ncbi:flagellar basal-body rod protein FlgG [Terriglobus roseus DSM 18391]|uniref:Flagellar basal-body rod protein FlgG n=1 Tax=Terriglobus roseus (strain DSM 18391 / NRRL B-41598 / KBS 63) TaxID=926566 RepID=I3ZFX1_TERRK|nr:flagellar basal-body rod protein FlgG [Terriglobus roseus]AFL88139.1 flagellar basal-body rod protein FlgG [Terriglobus roseus DSM 18391]
MIRALYTAASGMSAQQANLDTVANNLANSSTTGFRRRNLQFEDMMYQNMVMPGAAQTTSTTQAGLQIGLGTHAVSTEVVNTQGDFNQTGNQLDLAISGAGFFQVTRPDGTTAYTRDGSFKLTSAGQMVTANGEPLSPAITIPTNATSISISQYGVVTATIPGQTAASTLGQIQLVTFPNPGGLNSIGGNLLTASGASGNAVVDNPGGAAGLGTLQQGSLEASNVDVVEEFVQMVLAQRAYESNSKVIKTADDMYSQVNNLVR